MALVGGFFVGSVFFVSTCSYAHLARTSSELVALEAIAEALTMVFFAAGAVGQYDA